MTYDRADWHYGGDFPAGLAAECGATHIGMFLAWAILAGLEGDSHDEAALRAVRRRRMTGREFLISQCDEKLWEKDLNEEGNAFAKSYYSSGKTFGPYVDDYAKTLAAKLPSIYQVADTWKNFDKLKATIDRRYKAWQASQAPRSRKGKTASAADAKMRALQRKAADNSLEVEHLLKLAACGDASLVPSLQRLKAEHRWSDTGKEGRTRVVPFGRWCDVVCRFLEDGYDGIVALATARKTGKDYREFCVSLLEEMANTQSVTAIMAIGGKLLDAPAKDKAFALKVAEAVNRLLSLDDAPPVHKDAELRLREFLHRLLSLKLPEMERATVVCALRGVGDEHSIELIRSLPPMKSPYLGLEKAAIRQIQNSLEGGGGGETAQRQRRRNV